MRELDAATGLCAVIGNPVAHSLSPAMHNAAFAACKLNHVYLAFAVSDLAGFFAGMRAMPSFRGVSVTIPHKIAAMPFMDEVDAMSQKVGCINTVTQENGRLRGTITDGLGTLRAFRDAGVELAGRRVVFLGAGGAVRAVAFAMADEARVGKITLLGRSPEKLKGLADDLKHGTGCEIALGRLAEDAEEALKRHDVVVQGTPLGMYPESIGQSPVRGEWLSPGHVVFDMVYRPHRTQFIADAEAVGCATVIHGVEMLVNQAELQFEAWTGLDAPREVMRAALLKQLGVQ